MKTTKLAFAQYLLGSKDKLIVGTIENTKNDPDAQLSSPKNGNLLRSKRGFWSGVGNVIVNIICAVGMAIYFLFLIILNILAYTTPIGWFFVIMDWIT